MTGSSASRNPQLGRTSGCPRFLRAFVLFAIPAFAQAQYAVPGMLPNQNGRLLDRNPQVGNSYNDFIGSRPMSPLVGGNAFASGNVRGMSLRARGLIGAPTDFGARLGTSSFSDFIRDSTSVADSGNPIGQSFYDPATIAATGQYLRGGYSGTFGTGYRGSSRTDTPGLIQPQGPSTGVGLTTARLPYEPDVGGIRRNTQLPGMSSGVYGSTATELPSPAWLAQQKMLRNDPLDSAIRSPNLNGTIDFNTARRTALGERAPLGGPLEMLQRGGPQPIGQSGPLDLRLDPAALNTGPTVAAQPGITPRDRPPLPRAATPVPAVVDRGLLPGADVFNDMQLALALREQPQADWFTEMQAAAESTKQTDSTQAGKLNETATLQAREFVDKMLATPLQTFVGAGGTPVNDMLLKAEASMAIGRFREAADRYDDAIRLDRLSGAARRPNPLPYIGKANALLASGSYGPAADALIRSLELGPELARFNFDLQKLIGGLAVVDRRRSDLEGRLKSGEDARLRFLLGYLEYFGGYREQGLENLDRAAQDSKANSVIRNFPQLLRGATLPLPRTQPEKLPPTAPDAPPADSATEENETKGRE